MNKHRGEKHAGNASLMDNLVFRIHEKQTYDIDSDNFKIKDPRLECQ